MKKFALVLIAVFLWIQVAYAGEIFGTVLSGGKPVPKGTKVEVITAQKSYSALADAYGSYRVFVSEKGKCTLKVDVDKQSPSIEITSYEKSTRCDVRVESKDGRYSLKRK